MKIGTLVTLLYRASPGPVSATSRLVSLEPFGIVGEAALDCPIPAHSRGRAAPPRPKWGRARLLERLVAPGSERSVNGRGSPTPTPGSELLADEAKVVGRFEVGNPVVEETDAVRLAKAIQLVEPDGPWRNRSPKSLKKSSNPPGVYSSMMRAGSDPAFHMVWGSGEASAPSCPASP